MSTLLVRCLQHAGRMRNAPSYARPEAEQGAYGLGWVLGAMGRSPIDLCPPPMHFHAEDDPAFGWWCDDRGCSGEVE